ncbi:MAG: 4-hydroxy-3-methylbut-2-enyl diphosphate reductase [Candidatus Gastranaerophilales bacterium]|nr:4-hydroxy-3-methylbut-2-enyl diphosphate reductase [Candidatus Gastranaerophilales bacterium]
MYLKLTKNIKLAKHAGFCYGVKRAVETTKKLKDENSDKQIWVLGELIHNSHVIKQLESLGIKTVDNLPCDGCGICVIRSHGASPDVFDEAKKKGYEIVDLTCPDVKKVQQKAIQLAQEDYLVIIIGKPEHPEVLAIKANAQKHSENVYVVPDLLTLKLIEDKIKAHKKIGVVVQTTQRVQLLQEVVNYLTPMSKELKIFNTICASTTFRQNEARDLAKESDLMIVVGSKKSANTTHLAEILTDITKTIHIEDDTELKQYEYIIKNAKNISITAGASTPDDIIRNVIETINKY